MLVSTEGNPQSSALDDFIRVIAVVLEIKIVRVELFRVPLAYLQIQRLTDQCLTVTKFTDRSWARFPGVEHLHGSKHTGCMMLCRAGVCGFNEYTITIP